MRPPLRPSIHLLVALAVTVPLCGCEGGPEPDLAPDAELGSQAAHEAADHVDDEAAAAARRAREGARRELSRLCPVDERAVLWFEALRRGSERATLAAFFAASGGAGAGPYLDSVGLAAPGEPSLTMLRSREEVWIVPRGALGEELGHAPYRALTPDPLWDDGTEGRGRRAAPERIETRLGPLEVVRTEHTRSGDIGVRHFFAPDRGLVRLEVVVRQETVLRLELTEVAPRERPAGGYDVASPSALWRSVREAIRRLDVEALGRLMAPELHARARASAWDRVSDLAPPYRRPPGQDPLAERIRAEVGDLLQLDLRVRSAWAVTGDDAAATVLATIVDPATSVRRVERGQLVLRREPEGTWRWADVRLP